MKNIEPLFPKKLLERRLKSFDLSSLPDIAEKTTELGKWRTAILGGNLDKTKETAVQGQFFSRIFGRVLGYTSVIDDGEYTLTQEKTSKADSTFADGALGFFSKSAADIRVAIEVKDALTDLDAKQTRANRQTPVEQAFSYLYKNGASCRWVIVSNFVELRLYHRNTGMTKYQSFQIAELAEDEAQRKAFFYLLSRENLLQKNGLSKTEQLFDEAENAERDITAEFYKDYSSLRLRLFESLAESNPNVERLALFTAAQKIMDRFIFICFCEDKELLPRDTFGRVLGAAKNSFDLSPNRIWRELNGLFRSIDEGNPPMNINAFNGGLFQPDEVLDHLVVPDDTLLSFKTLADYDFSSELNVNILGHIFEQSIGDIEAIKQEITGKVAKSKRKADGIYYTPAYVTDFIIDKTIGRWMEDAQEIIRQRLLMGGFTVYTKTNKDGSPNKNSAVTLITWPEAMPTDEKECIAATKLFTVFYEEYAEALRSLRVLDAAVGSGAFLNAAFQYIYREIRRVQDTLEELRGGEIGLFDIDRQILENNLYGVDVNKESVEITKLSLWLQTANKDKKLTSLDHAIKCGNSLISDATVAGTAAFDWRREFPAILENGGFDIVIGNPPYGATLTQAEKDYIAAHYETTEYNFDTYKTFFELGMKLLKPDGYLGFITPNTYFVLEKGGEKLRRFLFDNATLLNVAELFNVFPDAVVEPAISIFQKRMPDDNAPLEVLSLPRNVTKTANFYADGVKNEFTQKDLKVREGYLFNFRETKEEQALREKIGRMSEPLGKYFAIITGIKPYQVGKGTPKQTKETMQKRPFTGYEKLDDSWIPYIRGMSMSRYLIAWDGEYVKYGKWLAEPRDPQAYSSPKIIVRQTADYPIATFDASGMIPKDTLYCIYHKETNEEISLKYVLAFLNSKIMKWIFQHENFLEVGKTFAQVKAGHVERLPLPILPAHADVEKIESYADTLLRLYQTRHDEQKKFTDYVVAAYKPKKLTEKLRACLEGEFDALLKELKSQKAELTATDKMELLPLFNEKLEKQVALSREIVATEEALDSEIYRIYALTEEEIAVVEGK